MTALDPNSPAEVADAIARMVDHLEHITGQYRDDIELAATSGAAYKREWAMSMLSVIASGTGRKMTVAEKEAMVEVETNELRVVADVNEARAKATKEALNSIRVALDSLRSLGANLRSMT